MPSASELHHRSKAVVAMMNAATYAPDIDDLDAMLDAARPHLVAWLVPADTAQRIHDLEQRLAESDERYQRLADELDRRVREWRDLDDLRRAENESLRARQRFARGRHRRRRSKGRK